jgi:DNA polymerase-3 subunit gamma/tau
MQQPAGAVIQPERRPESAPASKLEPIEKPSTTKVIRKLGSAYTPSIKDALSGNNPENKVQENTPNSSYNQKKTELLEPFTQEQMAAKWLEFMDRIADRPSLCSALSSIPELTDGNKLILKIGNSVQEEDIRQIKPELVSWLRTELRNSGIELTTKLEKIESERMIFSDSEKLQMMMQKNPELNVFKQKFNLDFTD